MVNYVEKFFAPQKKTTPLSAEEITERPTTKMGYFLLICMWIALFSLGEWSLTIIRDIPVPPKAVPVCIDDIIGLLDVTSTNANTYSDLTCVPNGGRLFDYNSDVTQAALVSDKPVFDLQKEYTELLPTAKKVQDVFKLREPIQAQIDFATGNLNAQQKQYELSLQEKTAGVEPVYNTPESAQSVKETESKIKPLRDQVAQYDSQITGLRETIAPALLELKAEVKTIDEAYTEALRWWQLKVDLLSLVFAGLIFTVLYGLYSRFKKANSPHTIIFSVATFAYGILLLQVVLGSIWDLIPHIFIEKLINFLKNFTPILYLLQFFIPLILVIVFGWLVYRIQKRLFSRENILKRIVADCRCPHCHNTIDITKAFCPLCDYQIQVECPRCRKLTIKSMPFCSNCGEHLSE